jgi:hypothetical protein
MKMNAQPQQRTLILRGEQDEPDSPARERKEKLYRRQYRSFVSFKIYQNRAAQLRRGRFLPLQEAPCYLAR